MLECRRLTILATLFAPLFALPPSERAAQQSSSSAGGSVPPILAAAAVPDNASVTECPKSWTTSITVPGKCYLAIPSTNLTNYMSGQRLCKNANPRANLVTLSHAFENSEVQNVGAVGGNYSLLYWIGLNDLAGSKQWQWLSGVKVDYRHWNAFEPIIDNGNICAHINISTGYWQTHPCSDQVGFGAICELYL